MKKKDESERAAARGILGTVAKRLFESRTILICGEINMLGAQSITAQLLALAAAGDDPITVYVHSPGGHVEAADTIFDMLRFVPPKIRMIGTGWVASAGAHIFLAAEKENRFCLPNTRFMIHQPAGGAGGRATDISIEAQEIIKMRARLNQIISERTGQPIKRVEKDTERNYWMGPDEAKEYGLVHRIVALASELP